MGAVSFYRHSGLAIASDFAVPEWESFACQRSDREDVTLRLAEAPLPETREGCDYAFAIDGVGQWLVRGGAEILIAPDPAADPAEWRLFTLGSAWGALGYQRGFAMWHGSAVARGGRAVMVCGESGAGKSTMAASLVARGARLVCDDLARVDPAPGGAVIHPASARLKLWGEVIDRLGWRGRVLHPDWLRADKFHCAMSEAMPPVPPVPLAAIVMLVEGPVLALDRVRGAEALRAVMAATLYRPDTIEALGKWGEQGALAARVLAGVPAYRLTRPRDLARLAEAAARLEMLWER